MVPPSQFIPIAEKTGLIIPIGRWVLEAACRQAETWRQRFPTTSLVMSVNVSGRQFRHPKLVEDVAHVLKTTGLPANYLKLEITETVAMEDGFTTIRTLHALKKLGPRLAIDDFGTGYSSLAYLKHFPVDEVKIDRSFITGLGQDSRDRAIVRTMIALAESLSIAVTAEGIERVDEVSLLRELACGQGQGFYFARPQLPESIEALLESGWWSNQDSATGHSTSSARDGGDTAGSAVLDSET